MQNSDCEIAADQVNYVIRMVCAEIFYMQQLNFICGLSDVMK